MPFPVEYNYNFSSGFARVDKFVGDEGGTADGGFNLDGDFEIPSDSRYLLTNPTDPLYAEPGLGLRFDPNGEFIRALNLSGVGSAPPGSIILYPLAVPALNAEEYAEYDPRIALIAPEAPASLRLTVYPDDLPNGWVPTAGQIYEYADGSAFVVPSISTGESELYYNSIYYRAAYLIKIPDRQDIVNVVNEPRRNFLAAVAPRPRTFSLL